MASKNIEINIKSSTGASGTGSDSYTTLYPKSLSNNIMYDSNSHITMQDKINNLSPNDTFELGDILCTSKINVDTEKWHLCDGSKLNREDYQNLFSITNLKNISGLKDITATLKPVDLDLQGWWECNGYYFRYIENSGKVTLYRCLKNKDLTTKTNWDSVVLENSSFTEYYLNNIVYLNNFFVVSGNYGIVEDTGEDGDATYFYLVMYIIKPDDFTLLKKINKSWTMWQNGSRTDYVEKTFPAVLCNGTYRFLAEVSTNLKSAHSLKELIYTISSDSTTLSSGSFSVNGDTVVSYTVSPSGYIELSISEVNGGYSMYISNAPTGIWSHSTTYERGWKLAKDKEGSSIKNLISKGVNNYFFFQDKTYTKDFSGGDSDFSSQKLNYIILGSVQGIPYYWNYDNTILYTYDSGIKTFYIYYLENDIFVLQYTLVNTDNYTFSHDNLSPNNLPLNKQNLTYQEMVNGIEVPTIEQTTQYKYYIKIK